MVEKKPKHPGNYVQAYLDTSNLTQDKFAKRLGVSRFSINQILNGHRSITAEMALRLEKETVIKAEVWMSFQNDYDIEKARQKLKCRRVK